jgi:ABC-type transport system involved in multi-copper enzyme maturation permease subunit
MTRLIETELLKLRTIRLPYWLLAGTAGLTALITGLLASRAGSVAPEGAHMGVGTTLPPLSTQAGIETIITATRFGLLFATILGIMMAAGEFRHGTMTPTYLASPHRNRVMVAKIIAAAGAGALFGLVASGVSTGVGLAFVANKGFAITVPATAVLRYAAGSALSAALFAAIGAAVGSLIRNQIPGIVGVFAWGLLFESILGEVFPWLARWLPYTASIAMAGRQAGTALPFGGAALLLASIATAVAIVASRITVQMDVA